LGGFVINYLTIKKEYIMKKRIFMAATMIGALVGMPQAAVPQPVIQGNGGTETERDEDGLLAKIMELSKAQQQEALDGHCDFEAMERDGIDPQAEMDRIMRESNEFGHCDFEAMERLGIDPQAEMDKIMREAAENEKRMGF
jgi:hypothetical protein